MLLNKLSQISKILLMSLLLSIAATLNVVAQEQDAPSGQALDDPKVMTQEKMAEIIGGLVGEYEGTPNYIQFVYNEVVMALISDKERNRMRIIAPITNVDNLTDAHIKAAMVSNFHLALDARYAIGNGILYAAYIHPLQELTKDQLESAVRQVSSLRLTFGTGYTSGELRYGGAASNPEEEDI